MNEVQPFISSADASLAGTFCLAICILLTIRYTYRYLVFKSIDRDGYSSPDLQAFHLREQAREQGKIITSTRKQGLIALAGLTGSLCLAFYFVPTWSF
jgi:hypothetical protein